MKKFNLKNKYLFEFFGLIFIGIPTSCLLFIGIFNLREPYLLVLYNILFSMGNMDAANRYLDLYHFFQSTSIGLMIPISLYILFIYPYYTNKSNENKSIKMLFIFLLTNFSLIWIWTNEFIFKFGLILIFALIIFLFVIIKKMNENVYHNVFKVSLLVLILVTISLTLFTARGVYQNVVDARYPETIVVDKNTSISSNSTDKICEIEKSALYCVVDKDGFFSRYYITSLELIINEENYHKYLNQRYSIDLYLLIKSVNYEIINIENMNDTFKIDIIIKDDLSNEKPSVLSYECFGINISNVENNLKFNDIIDHFKITYSKKE